MSLDADYRNTRTPKLLVNVMGTKALTVDDSNQTFSDAVNQIQELCEWTRFEIITSMG